MTKWTETGQIPENTSKGTSKAAVAYSILGELVDECVLDLIFETHREAKMNAAICQICHTKCRDFVSAPALDIFGNIPTETEQYPCENCGSMQTSSRYAPHLEKCLGLSTSRGSNRAARQRSAITNLATSSRYANGGQGYPRSVSPYTPNASEDREGSINDEEDGDGDGDWSSGLGKKRKKIGKTNLGSKMKKTKELPSDGSTKLKVVQRQITPIPPFYSSSTPSPQPLKNAVPPSSSTPKQILPESPSFTASNHAPTNRSGINGSSTNGSGRLGEDSYKLSGLGKEFVLETEFEQDRTSDARILFGKEAFEESDELDIDGEGEGK